ncbi:SDR family oxidoreductase [Lysinibacillus sp. SGAir0095]|uniref:SDR family oxidoreductase n=1 Tax=Lysinibacillus sp. SGAir0095 TaxID=2070463 RepID=UPI0010CCD10D|nr:SDR family oxidoreductase [Lysinibacillus sp. SGAir0095]QCR31614.1 3-beta hydroxysteroid dehydrogenase [Lysinibacillus sp. SGAir0095]
MGIHFFTGFPGFITSQLIRNVFKNEITNDIAVLVLQSELKKAQKEVTDILKEYPGREIKIIEGDITLENLGIAKEFLTKLKPDIEVFWHLAAIYDLAVPKEVAWTVNVHGTSMVNDFVLTLPNLKRYMYFSTAYVAGTREGNLLETELIRPLKFKNFYEETKFEAELLVEKLKSQVAITIIRPGIVRGSSETGETIKFDGPYFFLNMIDKLKALPFIPYIGKSNSTINVVPVDYIIEASTFLCTQPSAEGKTLHLTDPHPHPVQEVYRTMVKEMTGNYPKGRFPFSIARIGLQIPAIRKMLGVEIETMDYLMWNASFDCTQAQEILRKGDVRCPDFLSTMPSMIQFYKENKANKIFHIQIK